MQTRGVCQQLQPCICGFVQNKSGPVQLRCERCQKIPVAGGAIACACARIRFAAEVIYTLSRPVRALSAAIETSAGQFRTVAADFKSSAGRCERCQKIPVVDGAIPCACAGILFAAEVIYTLPGQFRTVAGEFRSPAERFGRASRQFRTQAGPMRTLPENSGRGRHHSVCVRRHSDRCRSYLHAARTIQDGGGGIPVVGGTIQESGERILLAVRPHADSADPSEA
jgi:hypothetical protein